MSGQGKGGKMKLILHVYASTSSHNVYMYGVIQTLGASECDGEASERNGGARRSRGTRRSGGSSVCCHCTNLSVLYGTDVMHDNRIGR